MTKRRAYIKPQIRQIKIDNEISMVMMSFGPSGDPASSLRKFNPLRWWK